MPRTITSRAAATLADCGGNPRKTSRKIRRERDIAIARAKRARATR